MERHIPVIFEKPPGRNVQEAQELAEISRRTGTPNQVAFNRRWAPCTQQALAWIREDGPFEYLYARMLRTTRMDKPSPSVPASIS
jgi:predicted dehydrogenase